MRDHAKRTKAVHLLTVACALALAAGLQVPSAGAQSVVAAVAPKPQTAPAMRPAGANISAPRGDQYYVEFRSRYAQSYGHAFVVFGRGPGPGKKISPNQIAGLHPATDSPIPFWVGHVIPVKSETGASEGDTDEIYVSARYRVMLSKPDYERTLAFIRNLQKNSPMWQEMIYNCNDFVADIAHFVGLKTGSSKVFPKEFITQLRELNEGRQRAALPAQSAQSAQSVQASQPSLQ
jgi:hypothetical protein